MAEPDNGTNKNPSGNRLRVWYFDDVSGGHHDSYAKGVIKATSESGAAVVALTPQDPMVDGVSWRRTSRSDAPGLRQSRTQMRERVANGIAVGLDLFVDLNLDRTIWLLPHSLGQVERRVHVLHHAGQYLTRQQPYERARTLFLRSYLRLLTGRGDVIVVHTARAAEILANFTRSQAVLRLQYPVRPIPSVNPDTLARHAGKPVLLFVGQAREEKGLADLLKAMSRLKTDAILRVVGPQRQEVRQEMIQRFSGISIEWIDSFVSEPELLKHLETASLVVTPYRTSFARDAGASGVLLSALASGKPLLTTDAISDQLPAGFQGAVVTPANDPDSLADGLELCLARLEALTQSAYEIGPNFIAEHHSFETYVSRILQETR